MIEMDLSFKEPKCFTLPSGEKYVITPIQLGDMKKVAEYLDVSREFEDFKKKLELKLEKVRKGSRKYDKILEENKIEIQNYSIQHLSPLMVELMYLSLYNVETWKPITKVEVKQYFSVKKMNIIIEEIMAATNDLPDDIRVESEGDEDPLHQKQENSSSDSGELESTPSKKRDTEKKTS